MEAGDSPQYPLPARAVPPGVYLIPAVDTAVKLLGGIVSGAELGTGRLVSRGGCSRSEHTTELNRPP